MLEQELGEVVSGSEGMGFVYAVELFEASNTPGAAAECDALSVVLYFAAGAALLKPRPDVVVMDIYFVDSASVLAAAVDSVYDLVDTD